MRQRLKTALFRVAQPVWTLLGLIVPKDPLAIAVNAFPDFDDSTRALAGALGGTHRKLFVLTTKRDVVPPRWIEGVETRVAYRYSVKGVWLYHRARFVLFTHGCFSAFRPSSRQVVVNIWHGMPLKKIGLLDGKAREDLPRFHYTIAADARFQAIISAAFGVPKECVLIADHPRLDVLRTKPDGVRGVFPEHDRLIVWLPTYRTSVIGDVRIDGEAAADVLGGGVDLRRLDALCARRRILCVVKPHPMARVEPNSFKQYKSLLLVDDDGLAVRGVSLYELLAASDLLITDVSSVYFDYKLLDRAVVLYCPDLQRYAATRGFVAPIETLVSDEIIETEDRLLARLENWATETPGVVSSAVARGSTSATQGLLRQIGMR